MRWHEAAKALLFVGQLGYFGKVLLNAILLGGFNLNIDWFWAFARKQQRMM